MSAYNEEMTKFRRLAILERLSDAPSYTLHEHAIKIGLAGQGQAVGTDVLRADLQWLGEQGLVYCRHPDGIWMATLTAQGNDVRQGLSKNPGIALPEPK